MQRGVNVGFVKNVFLDYYTQDIASLTYRDPAGEKSYTIGYTRDEYLGGVSMPWEVFANFLATGAPLEDYRGMTTYAQVDTGDPNVTLNLRKELPGFMVPRKMEQIREMPKLANGKIDFVGLRGMMNGKRE